MTLIQDTESFYKRLFSKFGLGLVGLGLMLNEGIGQRFLVLIGSSLMLLTLIDWISRR